MAIFYSRSASILPEIINPNNSTLWSLWNFPGSNLVARIRQVSIYNPINSFLTGVTPIAKLHIINFGTILSPGKASLCQLIPANPVNTLSPGKIVAMIHGNNVTYGNILRQTVYDFDDGGFTGNIRNWSTLPRASIIWNCTSDRISPLIIRENEGCAVWIDPSTPFHISYGSFVSPFAGTIEIYAIIDIEET